MKIEKILIQPTQPQIKLQKYSDLTKLARKLGTEIFEGPNYNFIVEAGFLIFATNPKKK